MKTKSTGLNNLKSNILAALMNPFTIFALADEGGDSGQPEVNYEALISKARQEEKDKLYPEINRLKTENALLTKQHNEALLKSGVLEQKIEKLEKELESGNKEESTKLQAKIDALTEENKKLKEDTPKEEDIRKSIEAEYEVKLYLKDKLAENKDLILSAFKNSVVGNTKEEVDEAIKKAIENSNETRKELGLEIPDEKGKGKDKGEKKSDKGQKKNNPPAPNPASGGDNNDELDLEYIRNLDPSSKEYKEWRKKQGLK